jgi:hypothetical protein
MPVVDAVGPQGSDNSSCADLPTDLCLDYPEADVVGVLPGQPAATPEPAKLPPPRTAFSQSRFSGVLAAVQQKGPLRRLLHSIRGRLGRRAIFAAVAAASGPLRRLAHSLRDRLARTFGRESHVPRVGFGPGRLTDGAASPPHQPVRQPVTGASKWQACRQRAQQVVQGQAVTAVMTLLTVWALIGADVGLLVTTAAADPALEAIVVVMFVAFMLELIVNSLTQSGCVAMRLAMHPRERR